MGDSPNTATIALAPDDWIPLIDAMSYLQYLPQCGDVARHLMEMFIAAADEEDVLVTVQYMGENGKRVTEYIRTDSELDQSEDE